MTAPRLSRASATVAGTGTVIALILGYAGLWTGESLWFAGMVVAAALTLLVCSRLDKLEHRARTSASVRAVAAGVSSINEARAAEGLPPAPADFQDRLDVYHRLDVWLVAERYDPRDLPPTATHVLIATGSPREITSIHDLRYGPGLRVGRPLRHVVSPASLPGLTRMPATAYRLNVDQIAELDHLTRYELPLEVAA